MSDRPEPTSVERLVDLDKKVDTLVMDFAYMRRDIDHRHADNQRRSEDTNVILKEIRDQVKLTNGRVSILEIDKAVRDSAIKAATNSDTRRLAVYMIVVPVLTSLIIYFLEKLK